jgi:hypothetical protein
MNTRDAAPNGIDALAGNCFWIATDAHGRISVDFALVPDPAIFMHRLKKWFADSGGKIEEISRLQYAIMKTQDLKGTLN